MGFGRTLIWFVAAANLYVNFGYMAGLMLLLSSIEYKNREKPKIHSCTI